jgi:hypothetical protein
MTNECRSSNDDKGRVIRDSLDRHIVTSDLWSNDLTRRSHPSFALARRSLGQGALCHFYSNLNALKKSISPR